MGEEFYRTVSDGAGQTWPIVGPAWKMSHAAAITDGAPRLGEHNAYVLGEILGLSAEEQQRLAEAGINALKQCAPPGSGAAPKQPWYSPSPKQLGLRLRQRQTLEPVSIF